MKKNFVLDTNVLLSDSRAIFKFADNNVVVPIVVIEELDKFKRDLDAVGRNARETARQLDKLREKGDLSKGVPLEGGGTFRVITDLGKEMPIPFPTLVKTADAYIIATAMMIQKKENLPVVFVTGDVNLRIRADAVGLNAVPFEEEGAVEIEEMYSGRVEIEVDALTLKKFIADGGMSSDGRELKAHQCVVLKDKADPTARGLGKFIEAEKRIAKLADAAEDMWGITPRNEEQRFAADLLMDDSVQLLTMAGKAGTGKTLLAIAAGLKKVVDEGKYQKLVVARPVLPMGKDLGYLPGELGEKLRPWMQPVFDNLELIINSRRGGGDDKRRTRRRTNDENGAKPLSDAVRQLMDMGYIEVEPLTYIRGRSLPNQYFIIDEAQNLTHHEVKTVVTRAGEGTKVVLTGDPYQIDNPFLDSANSGLTIVVERMKGHDVSGHITLVKGERSALAELASNLL